MVVGDVTRCGEQQDSVERKAGNPCSPGCGGQEGGGEGSMRRKARERVSVVMVPDAPLLIKDGWLVGRMDGWRSRDAILICAIIMCTQSPGG